MNIAQALMSLRPGSSWEINGETYEGIVWREENTTTIPSKEEVEAEILRLKNEYINNEYQRLRQREYPSFADQFDLLYHGGYDAWKAVIDDVKNKYPKP